MVRRLKTFTIGSSIEGKDSACLGSTCEAEADSAWNLAKRTQTSCQLPKADYQNLLSQRELEVLKLLGKKTIKKLPLP